MTRKAELFDWMMVMNLMARQNAKVPKAPHLIPVLIEGLVMFDEEKDATE